MWEYAGKIPSFVIEHSGPVTTAHGSGAEAVAELDVDPPQN